LPETAPDALESRSLPDTPAMRTPDQAKQMKVAKSSPAIRRKTRPQMMVFANM